jgi:flagellar hook-associated protein 2
MSTTATTIASDLTLGSATNGSGAISLPGLASGLNSAAIISEILSIDSQPMVELEIQQSRIEGQSTQLSNLQNSLNTVANDALNLSDPSLFDSTQTVTSSDPTVITATAATGAAIGGYQIAVSQLADSAQRTYTFTSPASSDAITIDGQALTISAGETMQSFVDQVNTSANLDVEAAITGTNTLVLSSKTTGVQSPGYISISDPGSALSEITADASAGQDAEFTVNGGATQSATSNTVTDAVPGVTLTLGGVTSVNSGPVTVVVSPPAANTASIESAVKQFVTDYNSAVNAVETQLTQTPISNPTNTTAAQQGTLFGDSELNSLLNNMRQMMYTPGSGLPQGMAALSDIGITTGAPTGDAAPSAQAVAGDLTIDSATLNTAIANNPSGVQAILSSFSLSFQALVNTDAGPGGVMSDRINENGDQTTEMSDQLSTMQANLTEQQTQLQNEYSKLEANISLSNSHESQLLSEINQLGTTSATATSTVA